VIQTVISAFVAGGTDEMGIAHFWSGMKTARIDSAQVDRFPAQRIARLSAGCPTIVAIKVDNRVANAAVAVEAHGIIRPFFAGRAGYNCFTGNALDLGGISGEPGRP